MAAGGLAAILLADKPVRIQVRIFAVSLIERVAAVQKAAVAQFLVAANDHLIAVNRRISSKKKLEPGTVELGVGIHGPLPMPF